MPVLLTSAAWVGLHFVTFALVFRRLAVFGSEKVILLYHLLSCAAAGMGVVLWGVWASSPEFFSALLAVIGLHGVYSMSFLVMWSSSEGGFSLRMMKALEGGPRPRSDVADEFIALGDTKRVQRLSSLQRSGWVREEGGLYRPTAAGVLLALLLRALHAINNYERTG